MKTAPIHSKRLGTRVYHDNDQCTERNNIEPENRKAGKGGLSLCRHCERLNKHFNKK